MNKTLIALIAIILIALGGYLIFNRGDDAIAGAKNASYLIDGKRVQLVDGVSEVEAAPGSAEKITTRYFGDEMQADLDGDGLQDIAFILTQSTGGSGTFFYAVAARNTAKGYVGSDGYPLGDRIAPQSTTFSQNPKQKYVVVFNYADRAANEPMTAKPTIGKSVYLKLNPETMQWGIVEPNFEGESNHSLVATATYSCDKGKTIAAAFYDGPTPVEPAPGEMPKPTGQVKVSLDGGAEMTLNQTISADGARYANADESFVFWNKGDTALIMRGNEMDLDYTNCVAKSAL